MIYIFGLGNPTEQYSMTRHNAGRIVLEYLAKKNDFTNWKKDSKAKALISSGSIEKEKMSFILPDNFMNNSGESTRMFIKSKKDLDKLVVVYDDLDLPIGKIKISFNKSSGGHNGLQSVINHVKSLEFTRIRIGVSPSTSTGKIRKPKGEDAVLKFLLKDFKEDEQKELKKISKIVGEALVVLSDDGREKAMNLFN
jgi:peptidyl-tRNA hydrolase, PTH1 family